MYDDTESWLSPEHRKFQNTLYLIQMPLRLYIHSKTAETPEDSLKYRITGLVITPPASCTTALFHSFPTSLREDKRGGRKPLWASFISSTWQTPTATLRQLCVGKHVRDLGSASLAFTFSLPLGIFWLRIPLLLHK